MKRLPAILLVLAFLGLGSGWFGALHDAAHEREDRAVALAAQRAGRPVPVAPVHDESNCEVHRLLHVPAISAGWVPVLVCLGLFVAFLTQIAPPLVSQPALLRIDCRGPPGC